MAHPFCAEEKEELLFRNESGQRMEVPHPKNGGFLFRKLLNLLRHLMQALHHVDVRLRVVWRGEGELFDFFGKVSKQSSGLFLLLKHERFDRVWRFHDKHSPFTADTPLCKPCTDKRIQKPVDAHSFYIDAFRKARSRQRAMSKAFEIDRGRFRMKP